MRVLIRYIGISYPSGNRCQEIGFSARGKHFSSLGGTNGQLPICSPRAGGLLQNAVPGSSVSSSGSPSSSAPMSIVHAPALSPVASSRAACKTTNHDYREGWGPVLTLREFDLTGCFEEGTILSSIKLT